jgi:hypothetical protein
MQSPSITELPFCTPLTRTKTTLISFIAVVRNTSRFKRLDDAKKQIKVQKYEDWNYYCN